MSTDLAGFDTIISLGTAVEQQGLDSPSLRAISRVANCSPSTLIAWFGTKAELHRRTLMTFGVRWRHLLLRTLVPTTPHDLFFARLRLAFAELARSDAQVGQVLDDLMLMEHQLIGDAFANTYSMPRETVDPQVIAVLHALLVSLWDARTYPDRDAAWSLLERAAAALAERSSRPGAADSAK